MHGVKGGSESVLNRSSHCFLASIIKSLSDYPRKFIVLDRPKYGLLERDVTNGHLTNECPTIFNLQN